MRRKENMGKLIEDSSVYLFDILSVLFNKVQKYEPCEKIRAKFLSTEGNTKEENKVTSSLRKIST
jgi:hypothetical protein